MMGFFADIENTVGGSSFTGSHSCMKDETFDDLNWKSVTGVDRYDFTKKLNYYSRQVFINSCRYY